MKAMFGLIAAIAVILLIVWKVGFSGFNPEEQANNLKTSIKPGMTWKQVVEIHNPGKYRVFGLDADGFTVQGSPEKFKATIFDDAVPKGLFPEGFAFEYYLSNEHHYSVEFDGQGKVVGPVERLPVLSDLMNQ